MPRKKTTAGRYRRFVFAFVADIRNIPKAVDVAHRKLLRSGVSITVLDIDYHEEVAKKYKVTSTPTYLVMQKDPGFNDSAFKTPYVVRRTDKLEDIQKWAAWIKSGRSPNK